jgi:hypothetical protein
MTAMAWDNAEQNEPGGWRDVWEVVRLDLLLLSSPPLLCYDAFLDFLFS